MKVMVTGGAGYIGSHTAHKLLAAGYEVIIYDNLSTGFNAAVPGAAELVIGDILDQKHLAQTIKEKSISAVVHCAAKIIVPESILKPLEYYETNVMGMVSLLKACAEEKVKKVVFCSAAAVYAGPVSVGPVAESALTKPPIPTVTQS